MLKMSKNKIKANNYKLKNYWCQEINSSFSKVYSKHMGSKINFLVFKILFGDLFRNGRIGRKR